MKRFPVAAATLIVIALLAACTTAAPTLDYQGVRMVGGDALELTLTLQEPSSTGIVRGTYYAGVARGTLRGELEGETLTAVLQPKENCTFSFLGTLTDNRLTGAFEPLDCTDGEAGTWELTRL